MGEPEVKFEIDEHGRIGCRVTNEGVLLSKEEKELIISNILRLQEQNTKLRELASILCFCMQIHKRCADCKLDGTKGELVHDPLLACRELHAMLRELGVEVDENDRD